MAPTKTRPGDTTRHHASRPATATPSHPFHFSANTVGDPQPTPPAKPSRNDHAEPVRVLVVDDREAERRELTDQLHTGFSQSVRIHTATSGRSAVAMLRRQTFDLVLIEYILPDTDGLELIERIAEFNDSMAMILVTDHGNETLAARAIQRGALDYLVRRDISPAALNRAATSAIRTAQLEDKGRRRMRQLRDEASSAEHFVRALSHDMSAGMMVLEDSLRRVEGACREAGISPEISEGFSHVTACLGQSKRLLDDLVSLARTGNFDTEATDVDLNEAIAEVLYEQDAAIAERAVELTIAPDLGTVRCNASRVRQLLTNLVRNALAHGCDAHHPKLSVSLDKRYSTGGDRRIWLSVWDNGGGIPRDARKDVFLPGKRFAPTAGTGMGLAIVQRIVSQYDGTVMVDPACPDGTAIVFSLPTQRQG